MHTHCCYFRQFARAMLGVLGVHIWVEEDPGSAASSLKVLVSNYTSVLDHIVVDVVVSHFVVSSLYELYFAYYRTHIFFSQFLVS